MRRARHCLPGLLLGLLLAQTANSESLTGRRIDLAGAAVGSHVLFAGGLESYSDRQLPEFTNQVDIFDMDSLTQSTASLSYAAGGASLCAVSLPNLAIFVGVAALGCAQCGITFRDTYEPGRGNHTWTRVCRGLSSIASSCSYFTRAGWVQETLLSGAYEVVTGAAVGHRAVFARARLHSEANTTLDVFDSTLRSWSSLVLPHKRQYANAVGAGNRTLLLPVISPAGGGNDALRHTVDILDLVTGVARAGLLSQPRRNLVVASVGSKALFAGGSTDSADPTVRWCSRVDVFDAGTGTWTQAELSVGRESL